MYNTLIHKIICFVTVVIMQVIVFDNIRFGNYIHPCVYVFLIMIMPFDTSQLRLLINGFIIGMTIDIFSGTPGLNAAATVFMAFVRPYIIVLTTKKSDVEDKNRPTVTEMGLKWFVVYGLLLLILHNLVLFWLEAFSVRLLGIVLLETLLSAVVSLLVILLIIYLLKPIKK